MLRPGEIEEALEQCLLRLQRGEDAETCLAGYPEMRGELAPLLDAAQQLRASAPPPPDSAAALARGRERLLRQAARQRAAHQRRLRTPWTHNLAAALTPLLRRSLAGTMAAVALIVILLAGTSAIASANSLPGDALYPVKLAAESVQLALTFDQESRVEVQNTIEQRRVDEAQRVVKERRVTRVSFRGVVESFDGSTLTAAGLTVHVTAGTRFTGPLPAPGLTVRVSAQSRGDGALTGELIETLTTAAPSPQPTLPPPTVTASPAAGAGNTPALQLVAQRSTPASTHPARATATATGEPSPAARPTASPTLTATCTLAASPAPSASSSPPPATAAPPREIEVRFAGLIDRLEPGLWEVAGVLVLITPATSIDERDSSAQVGAWVQVKGTRGADGRISARKIVVERGPQAEPVEELVEFQGVIEAISPNHWVVSGQNIQIKQTTIITGEPATGRQAEVQARRHPNGALVATSILVRESEDIPIEFVGTIDEIGDGYWIVSGYRVILDSQTIIQGTAALGARAQVQGLELAGGSIRALAILVQGPTPTSTTVPATPTATSLPPTEAPTAAPAITEATEAAVQDEPSATPTATTTPGDVSVP